MAVVPRGSLLDGMRGRLGDLVFRVQAGQTIVSHRPKQKRSSRPKTPARQQAVTRFQQAVEFAKVARERNAFRSLSRLLGGHSPYHVALQDFLSEPAIESVDTTGIGPSGGQITIRVTERIAVRSVRIRNLHRESNTPVSPSAIESIGSIPPGPQKSDTATPRFATASSPQDPADLSQLPPAALFFQRPGRSPLARSNDRDETRSAKQDQTSRSSSHGSPIRSDAESLPREVRASRISKIEPRRGLKSKDLVVEVWQVEIPWAGEIEIIASDYAGNKAANVYLVGPLG